MKGALIFVMGLVFVALFSLMNVHFFGKDTPVILNAMQGAWVFYTCNSIYDKIK